MCVPYYKTLDGLSVYDLLTDSLKDLLSGVNYYELLATCSKYSIDVTDMSENIIKQTIWKVFSHTVGADL